MNIQFRRWLPLLALFGVLLLLTLQPGAASVQAAAQSTDTPTPALPVLMPKLGSIPITAQNAAQVKQLMQIGSGGAQNVCWSPDGNTLAVATSIGLQLYNAYDWSKAPTALGPAFNASACTWSPHSRYIGLTNAQPSQSVPWKVAIWRVSDGTLFKAFNDASAVVWSPDGQSFITIDTDKHVRMWNGVTGALLNRFDTTNAAWSPDSRFVAFIDSHSTLSVWVISANASVLTDQAGWNGFAWSPNSHWLAVRSPGSAVGVAAVSMQQPTIAPIVLLKQNGWNDMSWSPDGNQLATAGRDSTVVIWQVADGSQLRILPIGHEVTRVVWQPTGKTIALEVFNVTVSSSYGDTPQAIELINAQTGEVFFDTLADSGAQIYAIHWSPTGRFLILDIYHPGADPGWSGIDLWSPIKGRQAPFASINTASETWSPNDLQLADVSLLGTSPSCCTYYGAAVIENLDSDPFIPNTELILQDEALTSPFLAWSPNGKYLRWSTAQWNIADNAMAKSTDSSCICNAFAWGADSDLAAGYVWAQMSGPNIHVGSSFGTKDKGVDIGFDNKIFSHGINASTLALSSNSHYVAFDAANNIYLWDIDQNSLFQTLTGHSAQVNTLAFSPDSQFIVSGSADTTIRIWSVDSGESLHILNGHTAAVNRVIWSPDGKQLASASNDQTVRIWDATTGALLQTLKGHTDSVVSVQWSPDGKLVASASKDGTIRLWDAVHGTLLNTVRGHVGAINDLSWSPDGKTLATAGADATIRLWGVP